jgi:hypothetical protein
VFQPRLGLRWRATAADRAAFPLIAVDYALLARLLAEPPRRLVSGYRASR